MQLWLTTSECEVHSCTYERGTSQCSVAFRNGFICQLPCSTPRAVECHIVLPTFTLQIWLHSQQHSHARQRSRVSKLFAAVECATHRRRHPPQHCHCSHGLTTSRYGINGGAPLHFPNAPLGCIENTAQYTPIKATLNRIHE